MARTAAASSTSVRLTRNATKQGHHRGDHSEPDAPPPPPGPSSPPSPPRRDTRARAHRHLDADPSLPPSNHPRLRSNAPQSQSQSHPHPSPQSSSTTNSTAPSLLHASPARKTRAAVASSSTDQTAYTPPLTRSRDKVRITYPNPNPPGPANGNGTALHDLEHDVSIPPSRPARTRRTARADPSPDLDTDLDADTDADADTPRRTRRGRTQRDTFDPDATPHAHPYNSRLDDGMSTPRTLRSHARSRTPEQGQVKERTPELARGGATASTRKRQRVYGDRFIPNREGQDLQASYSLLGDDVGPTTPSRQKKRAPNGEMHFQKVEEANRTYSRVLRHEVFGDSVPQPDYDSVSPEHLTTRTPPSYTSASTLPPASITPSTPSKNLFSYSAPRHASTNLTPSRTPQRSGAGGSSASAGGSATGPANLNVQSELYSLSPIRLSSQRILQTPRKPPRYINRVPYKVLDAPDLADDFYLNLVDWGSTNILGVGLADSVYMWDSTSGTVTKLCTLDHDTVTSVSWIQRGTHLAIGTGKGLVQIWDAERQRRLRTMTGHTMRVGALAWNDHILTSGSRDRLIYHRDVRSPDQHVRTLRGHTQEVCGLKWNTEDGQLASGSNDNNLLVWDKLGTSPTWRFGEHTAAVKAIAWSPHRRHLLASGGGTADRTIKFWNTATGQLVRDVDTGSQVCNLAWSVNSDEIVSTHGYSQNQIVVWKYPRMEQVASLTGHTFRVLYLAMSPDGTTVVTGAGDETLRFWKVFNRKGTGLGLQGEGRESRLASSAVIR